MATNGYHTNGEYYSNGVSTTPKIILYTNHMCPYAHRAHVALRELNLPYEEVIIDLNKPREPWYLKVNPRGLVPAMNFSNGFMNDEIITESAVVTQFIADLSPSHLQPDLNSNPRAPLLRARLKFFTDTWDSRVSIYFFPVLKLDTMAEKEQKVAEWLITFEKEIEPLLQDADPFFGGSKEFTLAEVHIAPFLIRLFAISNDVLLPKSLKVGLAKLPNFSRWARATISRESVTYIWDADSVVKQMGERIEHFKKQAKMSFGAELGDITVFHSYGSVGVHLVLMTERRI